MEVQFAVAGYGSEGKAETKRLQVVHVEEKRPKK